MGTVLQFVPSDDEIAQAWAAYDAAQIEVVRLYHDPSSNAHDRFKASIAAISLHRKFYRLCARAGVGG
jgi:hypothetical protein